MSESLLLYKVLNILIYGMLYLYIYKKLNRVEEKILFWNFFILYFIGGSFSAILFDYANIVFPSSGMLEINTDLTSWSIYFIIVFLLPILSILLVKIIFQNSYSSLSVFKKTNLLIIYFILFFIFFYIAFNTDLNNIISDQTHKGYSASLIDRYNLQYSGMYIFVVKVLSFIFLLTLCIEYFYRGKKKLSFAVFIFSLFIYGLIDNLIFISKLYFIAFAFSYLIIMLIDLDKKAYVPIIIIMAIGYVGFYFYNIGDNYEANYIEPILKGLTRFTFSIPYYIEYYMSNDFDMKIYFYSLLTGDIIVSPNIRVFSTMFDASNIEIEGSLASGIFVYNYANFGIFTMFKSLFEITILIYLYSHITKYWLTSIKLSIFLLLVFGIVNYSFVTIFVGPLIGYAFLLFLVFIINYKLISTRFEKK